MNVLIVGGTGFLGYHATHELLRRGHSVTALGRRTAPSDLFPSSVVVKAADVNQLSDDAVQELVKGHDAVVYAAGMDAGVPARKPAYEMFYNENVIAPARFFKLSRQAGAMRGVLCGSYFCHFDRIWPELRLAEHHPYIRSRREQEKATLEAASPTLDLMILELPFIFGATPGRVPLWSPLVRYARSPFPLFFTRGGTNMVAVSHVAEAIAGALEQGQGGGKYLVGEENLTWSEFFTRIARMMGKERNVITLPTAPVRLLLMAAQLSYTLRGLEPGLYPAEYVKVQTANTFFDPAPSRTALGYGQGGLNSAFQDTINASLNATGKH